MSVASSLVMAIITAVPDPTQQRIAQLIGSMNITEKLGMMEGTAG